MDFSFHLAGGVFEVAVEAVTHRRKNFFGESVVLSRTESHDFFPG
jgi:hypothetical protein